MDNIGVPETLNGPLRSAWHAYVDALAPLRPALYGYCRRLTGNIWDAEDLAQDALLRAFGQWGVTMPRIRDPRAYLLRTATNVWIDRLRQREREVRATAASLELQPPDWDPATASEVRDAGARLLQRLSPQESAAVILKEVFDMSLEEIAELLATTTGAVKAALHRGRGRLQEAEGGAASRRPLPSAELLDRFIERYNARDVKGLTALMLEGGSAENVGNSYHIGLDPNEGVPGFLYHLVHGHSDWPVEVPWNSARLRRVEFEGEWIVLYLVTTRRGHEALMGLMRVDERDGRIARIRSYGFCPDTLRAVGEMLGMRVFTGLYRAPDVVPAS